MQEIEIYQKIFQKSYEFFILNIFRTLLCNIMLIPFITAFMQHYLKHFGRNYVRL